MLFEDRARSVSDGEQIGVLGGTFDPVHNGHIAIARAAREHAALDRVLFVVSARPPHKRSGPYASSEDRYAMVQAALEGQPGMAPSRLEVERDGPSYTVDTLKKLDALCPGAELYLILGMDSLCDLPKWRDMRGILQRASLLVVPRPGKWVCPRELEGRFELLPMEEMDISSTEIRRRIFDGDSIDGLVPLAVEQMIRQQGIYDACRTDASRS